MSTIIPTDGLISFWDFQETSGPFIAKQGSGRYVLEASTFDAKARDWHQASVNRTNETPPGQPFGPISASIGQYQLLEVRDTAKQAPLLNIHGDNATMSMVAW